jgi:5-methyltetrahydropteroyltriglutamate--homocysteine methyltransferase
VLKLSRERILTTHVGSLPRPAALFELLSARDAGTDVAPEVFDRAAAQAVEQVVARQVACGVDVVNDGEMSKLSYTFYVNGRVAGVGKSAAAAARSREVMMGRDMLEHPDFAQRRVQPYDHFEYPACIGPVSYKDRRPLDQDIANLTAAAAKARPTDVFMTCASPGVLTKFIIDLYYKDEDAYVEALAKAMKTEYDAVAKAGFVLQIDCPDLASARNNQYRDKTDDEFLRIAERNIEALNYATADIPAESMRMHICWGNYEGPHTHDIPLVKVLPIAFKARPSAISFEGANPRHAHEWEELRDLAIPDDKVLIPGVIDSLTNFVEHPRLVAQHICHYADIVGRERVIAGGDCGFSTFAVGKTIVAPSIVWAKLGALAEGARMASERLWR